MKNKLIQTTPQDPATPRWIQAAITLSNDLKALVPCPVCQQDNLEVIDQIISEKQIERYLRCPKCGAYNSMRIVK